SPSFSAIGPSESRASCDPSLGLPRCEVTITAAPFSSARRMPGTEAWMRVSSVIRPASSCGTLRSARMNTRLPRRSWSASLLNFIVLLCRVQGDGDVQHAVGKAPLVVVPGGDLDEGAARDLGQRRIDDRAGRIVVEVGGDQLLGRVFENSLQVAFGG